MFFNFYEETQFIFIQFFIFFQFNIIRWNIRNSLKQLLLFSNFSNIFLSNEDICDFNFFLIYSCLWAT
ncbi:hypothetical protein HanIR_Chr06g0292711 [Helianthus annuus]|nr:hypothetical protein HanIR_Chr06g0292711 [Helianthus annuus]